MSLVNNYYWLYMESLYMYTQMLLVYIYMYLWTK